MIYFTEPSSVLNGPSSTPPVRHRRLDDQLDAGAGLEWLGEMALIAEGNDVVVKGLEVAVGDDGDSEGGVLAAVLGDAAWWLSC